MIVSAVINWIFDELIKLGMWAMVALLIHSLIA